eukprot:417953_1
MSQTLQEQEEQPSSYEKLLAIIYPRVRSFLSGTASGIAKCVVGHPFDTIKVRMQTEGYHGRFGGSLHTLTKTVTEEGIFAIYKGASLPMLGWGIIDSFLWLGLMESRRQVTRLKNYNDLSDFTLIEHFICGMLAGWTSTLAATPVEQIKARLQIQYADPTTKYYSGPIDCGKQLIRNNGFTGLYKGMTGSLLFRSFIGIYFTSYVVIKAFFNDKFGETLPAPFINFISGGNAATCFWIFALPFDCVKNRMMSQRDLHPRPYPNVLSCLKCIYTVEGFTGFYRGWIPCAIRSFPTNGAAFVAAEFALKCLPEQLGYHKLS